ncbi:MAG: hypothetical protein V3S46_04785, partial [Nitrospinota bacterium]
MEKWKNLANQNAESAGKLIEKLKEKWQSKFLHLAREFTAGLGYEAPEATEASEAPPLVVSGHQPYFLHHGVLYKYALLKKAAQKG